jgi:hypothetical protein
MSISHKVLADLYSITAGIRVNQLGSKLQFIMRSCLAYQSKYKRQSTITTHFTRRIYGLKIVIPVVGTTIAQNRYNVFSGYRSYFRFMV